jgi:hypothetical protein
MALTRPNAAPLAADLAARKSATAKEKNATP